MRILVTGANGFVGSALCLRLTASGHSVVAALRAPISGTEPALGVAEVKIIGDIAAHPRWDEALPGVDVVIHLAALVHQTEKPPVEEYRRVNAAGTARLARAAAEFGVRRLVFLSSLSVNAGRPASSAFTEEDAPSPRDDYGISKLEAEQELQEIQRGGDLETVIVRPPLVYGPGVPANFLRLLRIVHRMNPLIVPRLQGKRSMIGLGNLVDVLTVCATHPRAANQLFLVSDNEDVTVSDLMQRMAREMKHRTWTVPGSESLLRLAAKLIGREDEVRRVIDPLTVSPAKAMRLLNWTPPFDLNAGLATAVQWFLGSETA